MASCSSFTTTSPFKPFTVSLNSNTIPSLSTPSSNLGFRTNFRRCSLKVNAVATTKLEPSKVVPQADRVLIRLEDLAQKSAGGVLLPKSAVKFERYLMGEILAVGAEAGGLEAGKKVLFSDISAYEVDLGAGGRHVFCKAGDLLAVVE